MDGGLLVTHQHMAQARLGVERVVQRQHGAAGVAKIVSTPCAISVSNRIRAPLAAAGGRARGGGIGVRQDGKGGGVEAIVHADYLIRGWEEFLSSFPQITAIRSKFIFNMENLKKMNLDKFDLAILKVLQQNARASLNDIGAAVGLSSTPCWNRIKRMESAGVIRGYTVDIDPASLGFMDTVIVHVTLESHSEETLYEFGRALAQIPEVLEAFLVSGDYDYYIRIAVRDTRDYERLLREQLYRIPGIRHSKSCFVLRRLKETMLPLTGAANAPAEPAARELA